MAKKAKGPIDTTGHIARLIDFMAQGIYEKDRIIALALLCAVAGENMFLLGPPGTAKSMVASRLKMVFKNGKSFDYLMSRFSTPDEIFGPVSISRLKNHDTYERLTAGYLPEADIVFLDEIWKAGPSIQNTLLTAVNEHVFHNGGKVVQIPMKILIAASNELPANDEGLEALWDRFLVRAVSNCIESEANFVKMLKSPAVGMKALPDELYISDELWHKWQDESHGIGCSDFVIAAIKSLRKKLNKLEHDDGDNLRYYISDRRWRKAYGLMQTSAFLNGRREISLSDFLLLMHCLWNDPDCVENVLTAIASSISELTTNTLAKIEKMIKAVMVPQTSEPAPRPVRAANRQSEKFAEYDYFYYLLENFSQPDTYFSKWDYPSLTNSPREGVRYFDARRGKYIIHTVMPGTPFEIKNLNTSDITKIKVQKCDGGVIIDDVPYAFRRKSAPDDAVQNVDDAKKSVYEQVGEIQALFAKCLSEWSQMVSTEIHGQQNIFVSSSEMSIISKMVKEVDDQIRTTEVKLNNIAMMLK